MDSGIASDPLLAAALFTGLGALVASATLLAFIAITRARLLRRLAREEALAEQWHPLFAECAEQVPDPLPHLRERDAPVFLLLWCRAQESVRGDAQARLADLARRVGAEAYAHRMLRTRSLHQQLLALVTLGHLRNPAIVPLAELLIPAAPSIIALTAAQALLRIDSARALPRIVAATARREDWPLAIVTSLLQEADTAALGAVLATAIRAETRAARGGAGLARLLRLSTVMHPETLRPAVLEVLGKVQDSETLAAALKVLWSPEDVDHARRLLVHESWVVRVAASHALGRLGEASDAAHLEQRLGDRNWWVRYRAAQALCALPGMDAGALQALAGRLTDRFAADILRQALAERAAA
ncbi:MAG TPA: HEAT repeat domain-containing protein [Burkholderiales bacterium]|nr:HEAT repeat domain-containing protein [Burkholderiales bacterium]